MNIRKFTAVLATATLGIGLTLASIAAPASATGQETCPNTGDGWTKVELAPEPELFQVEATADADYLIAETCVKAATDVVYADVDPNATTVVIVAPSTHAISHYSYRQVPIPVIVPEKPELVVVSVPADTVDCEARVVTTTTTTTTTDWVLIDNVWVPGTPVITTASTTRDATEGECPIGEPAPRACVPVGDWYTEGDDDAPTLSQDGLVFNGGPKAATGLRVTASGNLQGWQPVSYVATGDTELFYFRIVIDSTADGGHSYSSLTVTSGSPVTLASTAYSNKLGVSKTLAEWAEFYPNAVITSVGFHLDSAASADDEVVLSSVTGPCATGDFTSEPEPTEPPVVTPEPNTPAPAAVTPTATELAETGFNASPLALLASAGLILAGAVLAIGAVIKRRQTV